MTTVYLAGPINGCTDEECMEWREYFKQQWEGPGRHVRDPMRRDYRGSEVDAFEEIVEYDKEDICMSEMMVAMCPKPSYGTAMEIYYAWQMDVPCCVILPKEGPVSPWILYHATKIVHTIEDALKWVFQK